MNRAPTVPVSSPVPSAAGAAPDAPRRPPDTRIAALRRFGFAISVLTTFGQTLLGFEPGWIHVFAALGTAYGMEALLEIVDARLAGRRLAWAGGGLMRVVDFFLPSHITGLAVAMLLYAGERVLPIMFGVAIAVGSKSMFRAAVGPGRRHFLNPSNTGIAAGLLLLPWMGSSPPYQFTENVTGAWDWVIPGIVVCTGTLLNAKLTRKIPLIVGWLGGMVVQGVVRSLFFDAHPWTPLTQMTGMAFVLFSNYMISDPATTPTRPSRQLLFGASVALLYGALRVAHIYFALFYALLIICALRGAWLTWLEHTGPRPRPLAPVPVDAR